MKANRLSYPITIATAGIAALALHGCSDRMVPAPAPRPVQTPRPAPPPPAPQVGWQQAALTPGDWTWGMEGGQSVARFAGGQLVLRCDSRGRSLSMLRAGRAQADVAMRVSTSAMTRSFSAKPESGSSPSIAVTFQVRDPLLDAMAFSRGRFAVEASGLPTLIVPSWPEVSRVIEDCR